MIIKDDLAKYVPFRWQLVHPSMYELALCAVARKIAQVAIIEGHIKIDIYWQRDVDSEQLELGL